MMVNSRTLRDKKAQKKNNNPTKMTKIGNLLQRKREWKKGRSERREDI